MMQSSYSALSAIMLAWLGVATAFSPVAAQSPISANRPKSLEGGIKTYADITARIAKYVTPAHLAECKRLWESQRTAVGIIHRIVGPLTPNPIGTCAVAFQILFQEPLQDRAVCGENAVESGGRLDMQRALYATCVMRLENGDIIVDPNGPTYVTHHCESLQDGVRPKQ